MAALLGLISIFSVIDLNSSLPGQDNRASGSNHFYSSPLCLSLGLQQQNQTIPTDFSPLWGN